MERAELSIEDHRVIFAAVTAFMTSEKLPIRLPDNASFGARYEAVYNEIVTAYLKTAPRS